MPGVQVIDSCSAQIMAPLSKVLRGRSASVTPPRAVFQDLRTAYTNITGRSQAPPANLPLLSPGWAEDQPATLGNPKSTPISAKARTASQEHPSGSPLACRSTHTARPAPVGTPEIPESELGTRFPSASPREMHFDGLAPWPVPPNDAQASHRRSRSAGFLSESFPWYEAEYASNPSQLLRSRQHRFPSALSNTDRSSSQAEDHFELPVFQFPIQATEDPFHYDSEIRGRSRVIAATSTISDILQSYEDRDHPEDRMLDEDSINFPHMTAGNLPGEYASEDHHEGQLSQSAWSPRTSSGGMEFHYQRHSTHGEILNADDEPRDAVNEFLQEVFRPQSESADSRPGTNAYAMLVRANGETVSRPMSYAEMRTYENTVQTHIRDPSSPSIFDAGAYSYEGRLSLEYQQPQGQNMSYDSTYSMSSSSPSLATWDRRQTEAAALRSNQQARPGHRDEDASGLQRRGTPPLLFGANAINADQSSNLVTDRGNTDDGDWETVGNLSRHDTQGIPRTQVDSSSFADCSSSSTDMRPAGLPPGGQMLEHSSHPRYMRTWNMFRDQRTGQTMLLPDAGAAQGHNIPGDSLHSPVSRQAPAYHYHHPSPLSEGHTNPFTSSPVSADQGSASLYSVDNSNQGESDNDVLEMSTSARKPIKLPNGGSSGRDHSSAWVSTEEGHSNLGGSNNGPQRSLINRTAYQGNVTGTPEGTGTRQVGSSIANASSPGVNCSSSPYVVNIEGDQIRYPEASKQKSISINSSLSTEDSYWATKRQSPGQNNTDPEEYELTALPSFAHIPPEARFHRNQLIAHNLLPRDSPPSSKRQSLGLNYLANSPSNLKKATAVTGANVTRHFQQFIPNMPALSAVRKRSPHRHDAQDKCVSSYIEMQNNDHQHGRKTKANRTKSNTKSKVSDSEGSVESDVGLTSSKQPQQASNQLQQSEPIMSTSAEPVELEGVQVHPTHTGISHGQARATQQTRSAQTVSFQTEHGNTTEYNLQRLLHEPNIEEMLGAVRDSRPTPRVAVANRPIARAESPHLYRIPRPPTDALLKRQKELGRLVLVLCMVFPPLCLLYACNNLDGIMDHWTRGELPEMPAAEKKFALCYTVVSMAGIFAAAIWYLVTHAA